MTLDNFVSEGNSYLNVQTGQTINNKIIEVRSCWQGTVEIQLIQADYLFVYFIFLFTEGAQVFKYFHLIPLSFPNE